MRIEADLHIHSVLSPCEDLEMSPRAIVARALQEGLNLICVADHNALANSLVTRELALAAGLHAWVGLEAQTAEEVHLLCYFDDPQQAREAYGHLYDWLPDIPNNVDYFGEQLLVDGEDEILGEESRMLLNSLSASVEEVAALVEGHGGLVVPAHVESERFGLITQLGFIPGLFLGRPVEVSYHLDTPQVLDLYPDLGGYSLMAGSDAHYLRDIGRGRTVYEAGDFSLAGLLQAGMLERQAARRTDT